MCVGNLRIMISRARVVTDESATERKLRARRLQRRKARAARKFPHRGITASGEATKAERGRRFARGLSTASAHGPTSPADVGVRLRHDARRNRQHGYCRYDTNAHRLPPPPDPTARRRAFGVDAQTPIYLCVQNLRKLHPDFDDVLSALLARDPRGRVVLVADEQSGITDTLMGRLRESLGPNIRRVGVVPRQERAGYLRLVSCADVLLDTLHYGSSANRCGRHGLRDAAGHPPPAASTTTDGRPPSSPVPG